MSISENERHQLFTWFEEQMGIERAATMTNLVPPVGWGDIATRRDFVNLDSKIHGAAEGLDAKIDRAVERLDAKIDGAVDRLDAKIDAVAGQLDAKISAVDVKIDAFAERLDNKFDALDSMCDRRFSALETRLDGLDARLDRMNQSFITWVFAAQGAVVAAIGILLAVM
jgi:hypothetical protein